HALPSTAPGRRERRSLRSMIQVSPHPSTASFYAIYLDVKILDFKTLVNRLGKDFHSFTKRFAIARPMPLLAPVISTIFPYMARGKIRLYCPATAPAADLD